MANRLFDLCHPKLTVKEFRRLHRVFWKPFRCQVHDITPRFDLFIFSPSTGTLQDFSYC